MSECQCDFVKYTPICGDDGRTYISPCHAGCTEQSLDENGTKCYSGCSCILSNDLMNYESDFIGGSAVASACPVDCSYQLILFMTILGLEKFISSSGRSANFLISIRCIREDDKSISIGISMALHSLFAFLPAPIVFGWIIDTTCTLWGKTCSGTGNCWVYDGEQLRFALNLSAALLTLLGTLCDVGVWYLVKDLIIFDEHRMRVSCNDDNVSSAYDPSVSDVNSMIDE